MTGFLWELLIVIIYKKPTSLIFLFLFLFCLFRVITLKPDVSHVVTFLENRNANTPLDLFLGLFSDTF
jgi:hypothetical protein